MPDTITVDCQGTRDLIARVNANCPGSDVARLAEAASHMLDVIGRARDALRRAGMPVTGDDLAGLIDAHDREAREAVRSLAVKTARLRAGGTNPAEIRDEWAAEVTYLDGRKSHQPTGDDSELAGWTADCMTMHLASLDEATRRLHGVKAAAVVTRSVIRYDDDTTVISPWRRVRDGRVLKED